PKWMMTPNSRSCHAACCGEGLMSVKFWARPAEAAARQNAESIAATIAAERAGRNMTILDLDSRMLSTNSIVQRDRREKMKTTQRLPHLEKDQRTIGSVRQIS